MTIFDVLILCSSIALLIYLFCALMKPEWFA